MSVQTNLDLGAYRQAMLSVAPERLEQFSLAMKQNIHDTKMHKKKKKTSDKKHHKTESSTKSKKDGKKKRKRKNSDVEEKRKKKSATKRTAVKIDKDKDDSIYGDSDIEENGLNLSAPLHPLSHYVKNRENLMDQVFSIVKGPKLHAMLPDKLKGVFSDDVLKKKCLAHLEVMSSKRILHVISGEPMDSSSGTDSSDDNEAEAKPDNTVKHFSNNSPSKSKDHDNLQTNFIDSTTPSDLISTKHSSGVANNDQSISEDSPLVSTSTACKTLNKSHEEEIEEEEVEYFEGEDYEDMVDSMLEESLPTSVNTATPNTAEDTPPADSVNCSNSSEVNQLEYLEQQLRLRAIKSLMKSTGRLHVPES